MSVKIIDTIKQKNNGSFPVVNIEDIASQLFELAANKALGTDEHGWLKLEDKQSAYNVAFVTEATVLMPNGTASVGTSGFVARADHVHPSDPSKVNLSVFQEETSNLQNQINQIVISASSESVVAPEVAAARVGADSTSYQTLKERLDAESDAHSSVESYLVDSIRPLTGKEEKTFHLSDKDGNYYFWNYTLKHGQRYTITNTGEKKITGIYLRAEKYVTPSLQTITNDLAAGKSVTFTSTYDAAWIVMTSSLSGDESFSAKIEDPSATIPTLETDVAAATQLSTNVDKMLRQFVSIDTSLNASDFEYGYRSNYGDSVHESTTRITSKAPILRYEFDTIITPVGTGRLYIIKDGQSSASWTDQPVSIPAGVGFSITLKYTDDAEITSISDLVSLFVITDEFTDEVGLIRNAAAATPSLAEDVADAADDIAEINRKLNEFVTINPAHFNADDFILGGRGAYNGGASSATNRATYNPAIYHTTNKITIVPDNTVKIYVYKQDYRVINWTSDPVVLSANSNFTIVIAYTDDREILSISDLTSLFALYSDYDEAVAEIKAAVNKIDQMPLDEYAGKKISILGDSISTFGGSASADPSERISDGTYTYAGNRCRYPQSNLLMNVQETYWMQMILKFGMQLGINESWAGSRVTWDGTTESQDIGADKHIASATRIGHLDENGTPDIILVNAGTNDIGASVTVGTFNYDNPMNYTEEEIAALPVATFADAYRTMLIRLQKWFPTSRIVVLLPNFTSTYYTPQKADEYCEIIKEACDYFGVKWLDMRSSGITMFNRATYLPDGIHYNAKGMEIVAKNVEKFMSFSFTV